MLKLCFARRAAVPKDVGKSRHSTFKTAYTMQIAQLLQLHKPCSDKGCRPRPHCSSSLVLLRCAASAAAAVHGCSAEWHISGMRSYQQAAAKHTGTCQLLIIKGHGAKAYCAIQGAHECHPKPTVGATAAV
jgi:hypothetical protein